ncbi:MAG: efflux RND transporter periplasmic adaptor subunit [Bacteroides sp.]|nr:efflux RND transporter periplasmic adaptor subunit [Bacteroides sp.]
MNKEIIIATLAAGLALASCGGHKKSESEMAEQSIDVALPEIDSVTLRTVYPGELLANNTVDIVARVSGQLISKNYTGGQFVKKGTVLFKIEDNKYRDAVQQAEAALITAKSEKEYAQSHYEAVKKALESDAVSKMEVNQAESNLNQAEASIKNAQAALETARTNLGYCTITAPLSGFITSSAIDVGNYLNGEGSAVKLATLYDDAILIAQFAIESDDADVNKLSKTALSNIPLSFTDSVSHTYYGDLTYVAPAVDSGTGTLVLQCQIDNKYNELRPGMFVKVELPEETLQKAILVKDASISTDQLGKYLYVVNDSNTVVYTPIKVGPLYRDSLRVVYSGLSPNSKYVTKALLKVREGMKVNPHVVK